MIIFYIFIDIDKMITKFINYDKFCLYVCKCNECGKNEIVSVKKNLHCSKFILIYMQIADFVHLGTLYKSLCDEY